MKKIIITGITGQDGIFLTKLLLEKSENYNIFGVGRNTKEKVFLKGYRLLVNILKTIQI